jgi:hypothetical protein
MVALLDHQAALDHRINRACELPRLRLGKAARKKQHLMRRHSVSAKESQNVTLGSVQPLIDGSDGAPHKISKLRNVECVNPWRAVIVAEKAEEISKSCGWVVSWQWGAVALKADQHHHRAHK